MNGINPPSRPGRVRRRRRAGGHLGGDAEFETIADGYHGFVHPDFVEREVFADLSPATDDVTTYVTHLDNAMFVRYLVDDEGVFFSVDPDTTIVPLLERIDEIVS